MNIKRVLVILSISCAFSTLSITAHNNNHKSKSLKLSQAVDINSDPNVFETTIIAAPKVMRLKNGEKVTVFAYNGQVPGPEIRVKRGDRIIVHLKNKLPDGFPTTIHWHGIELNNRSDGTPMTQEPVLPGESYTYDFIVPRAGVFWYHPHVRGSQVVSAGLYAPLIVTQPEEKELVQKHILPKRDMTVVLSDLSVVDGQLKDIESTPMLETMNGVEGEIILVNGKQFPTLNLRNGKPIRLRLVNASITRYFRLSLPGHTIYRVGGEGGLLSKVRVEGGPIKGMRMKMDESYTGDTGMIMIDQGYDRGEILLTPAQRVDVVIIPNNKAGKELNLQWVDYARGRHMMMMTPNGMMMTEADDDGLRSTVDILKIKMPRGKIKRRHHLRLKENTPLVEAPVALQPLRTDSQIKLQANMMAMMMGKPKSTWFKIDGFSGVDGRDNYRIAAIGDVVEWETHNHTDMHHPFHLHGFSFQATRFVKMNHEKGYMDIWEVNDQHEYVDTINVPPHTSVFYNFEVGQRPEFGAEVGTENGLGSLGDWVFHCHIFQHGENGMMSFLRVE